MEGLYPIAPCGRYQTGQQKAHENVKGGSDDEKVFNSYDVLGNAVISR